MTAQVMLTGNPNCGKTTLFNALTGLRAKVGNYAGVTVERKEGRMLHAPPDKQITILDLPGTIKQAAISRRTDFARRAVSPVAGCATPGVVVIVVDASTWNGISITPHKSLNWVTQPSSR
jgi:ferrous iron transport protein B